MLVVLTSPGRHVVLAWQAMRRGLNGHVNISRLQHAIHIAGAAGVETATVHAAQVACERAEESLAGRAAAAADDDEDENELMSHPTGRGSRLATPHADASAATPVPACT